MSTHVFISSVSENRDTVARLEADLHAAGITTWSYTKDLRPGAWWKDEIRAAIRGGGFFIACFSAESVSRDRSGMNDELWLAMDELRQRPANRTWFIPVKLSPCEIPDQEIGGGKTLRDIHFLELYPDWDRAVAILIQTLKDAPRPRFSPSPPAAAPPPSQQRRSRISPRTVRIGVATVVAVLIYAVLLQRLWPIAFPGTTDDAAAIELLAEALTHAKADRIADAYHASVSAATAARTPAVRERAATLRLLLAISLSEGHQMLGETLAKGSGSAPESHRQRYNGLAVRQSMLAFKWSKKTAESLDALSPDPLQRVHFPRIELSNPLAPAAEGALKLHGAIGSGAWVPADADIERVSAMLTAQTLRFYVATALRAGGGERVEAMTRDLWSGTVTWSPAVIASFHRHLTTMADKGLRMAAAMQARPVENRFSVGESFGLDEELDAAFCRSVLESLRRFVDRARIEAASPRDATELGVLLQDVDRRLASISSTVGGKP